MFSSPSLSPSMPSQAPKCLPPRRSMSIFPQTTSSSSSPPLSSPSSAVATSSSSPSLPAVRCKKDASDSLRKQPQQHSIGFNQSSVVTLPRTSPQVQPIHQPLISPSSSTQQALSPSLISRPVFRGSTSISQQEVEPSSAGSNNKSNDNHIKLNSDNKFPAVTAKANASRSSTEAVSSLSDSRPNAPQATPDGSTQRQPQQPLPLESPSLTVADTSKTVCSLTCSSYSSSSSSSSYTAASFPSSSLQSSTPNPTPLQPQEQEQEPSPPPPSPPQENKNPKISPSSFRSPFPSTDIPAKLNHHLRQTQTEEHFQKPSSLPLTKPSSLLPIATATTTTHTTNITGSSGLEKEKKRDEENKLSTTLNNIIPTSSISSNSSSSTSNSNQNKPPTTITTTTNNNTPRDIQPKNIVQKKAVGFAAKMGPHRKASFSYPSYSSSSSSSSASSSPAHSPASTNLPGKLHHNHTLTKPFPSSQPQAVSSLSSSATISQQQYASPRKKTTQPIEAVPSQSSRTQIKPPQNTGPAQNSASSSSSTLLSSAVSTGPKILSRHFFECSTADIITLVSSMLQELVILNDALPFDAQHLTRFHSRSHPPISIRDYLIRITKFCSLEKSIIMAIIYYIDLLCTTFNIFNINSLTVHRFLITAAMVASKGLCDTFCTNTHYAKVGGLSRVELNSLEIEFLIRVDYRIVPQVERMDQYFERMVMRMGDKYQFKLVSPTKTVIPQPQPQQQQIASTPSTANTNNESPGKSTQDLQQLKRQQQQRFSCSSSSSSSIEPIGDQHPSNSSQSSIVLPSEVAAREGRLSKSSNRKRPPVTGDSTRHDLFTCSGNGSGSSNNGNRKKPSNNTNDINSDTAISKHQVNSRKKSHSHHHSHHHPHSSSSGSSRSSCASRRSSNSNGGNGSSDAPDRMSTSASGIPTNERHATGDHTTVGGTATISLPLSTSRTATNEIPSNVSRSNASEHRRRTIGERSSTITRSYPNREEHATSSFTSASASQPSTALGYNSMDEDDCEDDELIDEDDDDDSDGDSAVWYEN